MKNASLILNGVLLVAVGVLYFLHFSGGKKSSSDGVTGPIGDLKFAYINSDSVLKHYDYFKVTSDRLEEKNKKLSQDLQNRAEGLRGEYASYQRNVGNLTIGQAKALEEDLTKKQQNLQMYQQTLSQEMNDEQAKVTQELYTRVTDYIKKYSMENGILVVLKYDPSSDLLYGTPALDISKQVIAGLNEAYQLEKNAPTKAKADSAAKK